MHSRLARTVAVLGLIFAAACSAAPSPAPAGTPFAVAPPVAAPAAPVFTLPPRTIWTLPPLTVPVALPLAAAPTWPALGLTLPTIAPPKPMSFADTVAAAKADGATAICADGTWSYSAHRSGTCSHHGGVHWWTGNLGAAGPGGH